MLVFSKRYCDFSLRSIFYVLLFETQFHLVSKYKKMYIYDKCVSVSAMSNEQRSDGQRVHQQRARKNMIHKRIMNERKQCHIKYR